MNNIAPRIISADFFSLKMIYRDLMKQFNETLPRNISIDEFVKKKIFSKKDIFKYIGTKKKKIKNIRVYQICKYENVFVMMRVSVYKLKNKKKGGRK